MPNVALRGVPEHVRRRIKDAAHANHRSVNGEILVRLVASVSAEPAPTVAAIHPRTQTAIRRDAGPHRGGRRLLRPSPRIRTRGMACRLLTH